jgi:hypothetical protein
VAGIPGLELKPLWRGGRLAPTDSGDFLPHVYPEIAAGVDEKLLELVKETGSGTILVSCLYTLANLRRAAAAAAGSPAIEDLGTFLLGRM